MVEFQTFALVNGNQANAVNLVAMDVFFMYVFIPFAKEGIYIRHTFYQVFVQLVIKGTHIRTLVVEYAQFEYPEQLFYQVDDGKVCQAIHGIHKLMRKILVHVFYVCKQVAISQWSLLDVCLVSLHQ